MKHYLFPKFFQHLSAEELMEKCCEYNIDGPNALIRDGYWLSEENLLTNIGGFVKTAESFGMEVKYADTDIPMDRIDEKLDLIKAMKDNGVEKFRLAYLYKHTFDGRIREIEDYVRASMAHVAEVAEQVGIQAIVQIHGLAYPHNASTAYHCIKGLDPKHIGIKLDPGNNYSIEGYELLTYQVPLLGEYIAALGEKDAMLVKGEDQHDGKKGWYRPFAPAFEGCSDYNTVFTELKKIDFKGPGIFMPMYHENDFARMDQDFKKEIKYFYDLEKEMGL